MTDITIIKHGLAQRAQDVAEMLLPRGKKEGHEWRAGSVFGEPGNSLGVHLTGSKAGLWRDFASDGDQSGGDLIDLWVATSGLPLKEVLQRARDYLGLSIPEPYRPAKKTFKRPSKPKCRRPEEVVFDYLREVRNLSPEAIDAYKIGERDADIIFPFLSPEGELLLAKRRPVSPKQGEPKCKPTSRDAQPCLFGWQTIDPNAREVTIVEGELDAPSLWDYGRPALSVPFGGGGGAKQQWIEHEFDNLAQFETIYLALDDDQEGDAAAEEIASRLGRHRCLRVRLPYKDANDCLVAGVPREEIDEAFKDAETLDPEGLKLPSEYWEAVEKLFYPEGDEQGYSLPYSGVGMRFLCRDGEMSLWSGYTGDGKSQILNDCIVDWVNQGARICVASYEMHPRQTLKRMVKQATNIDRPKREYIKSTLGWLDDGLVMYEKVGKGDVEETLNIFEYARAKYGCDMFVIDSLMRMGVAADDYAAQEAVVYKIVDWAVKNQVHVHLVAHSRKPDSKHYGIQDAHDVKGAMEIGANASNILIVWRNRKLEDKIDHARRQGNEDELEELLDTPGVVLNIAKQRNGDWEGKTGLYFDKETYRYASSRKGPHRSYPIPCGGGRSGGEAHESPEAPDREGADTHESDMPF